jgi:23S rRNA (pseudouridine1915-N3)-methyltransferase
MILHLIAVGRVKNDSLREVCADYERRIRNYTALNVKEVRDAGRTDRVADYVRKKEGEALAKALPQGIHTVALTRTGRSISSTGLAERLRTWRDGNTDVAFVIGGAHGLGPTLVEAAHETLSLSVMTFPHELARLALLEQLYRACTILRGEPYHKGGDR